MKNVTFSQPDFLLIGAMKCGTSTLQTQLAAQEGVFMATPKEPNFFSDDDIYLKGEKWYRSLFKAAAPTDLKGEASTHYTKLPTHPHTISRLQEMLATPRLIYMIRNPVARAVSHYIHEWSEARMGNDPVAEFARHPEILDYGRYGMQIRPWIETFGQNAVLLTSLEQIKADPQGELTRIATHLGATSAFSWNFDIEAQNVSSARMRKLPLQGLILDNVIAQALRRALVPKALRSRLREARTLKTRPELPDPLIRKMEQEFLADRSLLAQYFPSHPALRDAYPFASE